MLSENNVYISKQNRQFILPPELNDVGSEKFPLYILVALWAFRQGKPVTVKMVREAFSISIRRASDILEYMMEHGEGVIDAVCTVHYIEQGDRRLRRVWVVRGVCQKLSTYSRKDPVVNREVKRSKEKKVIDRTEELRRWFISRPKGKTVPDDLV